MSLLSTLAPKDGSMHYRKRLGRGRGSGLGQTSGKGHKGQLARTGGTVRRGFEGGQSPLVRRLPKFGFTNVAFKNEFGIINIKDLNQFDGVVDIDTLKAKGFVKASSQFKVLGVGELKKALTVKANAFSESAKKAIESAGGKVEVIK